MKKFFSAILTISMLTSAVAAIASEDSTINVTIDGEAKVFDVMPVIQNSRTLVPMRGIFEALGAEIEWNGETKTVTGTKGNATVTLQIGNNVANVNGEDVTLDAPAKVISDRTMVPARFVSDALGYNVSWDDATKTVVITSGTHMLDGKKVLFMCNSHTYRGYTVLQKQNDVLTQEERSNDQGYFYQLCKANGAEVSVTNWTFGNHGLRSLFGAPCNVNGVCKDVMHEEYLTDRYFDYVFINPGVGKSSAEKLLEDFEYIMNFFREANPNVKFVCVGNVSVYGRNATDTAYPAITQNYKTIEEMGVTIADWGRIIDAILSGEVTVPGATQTYNRKSFIVKDNYHPNTLTGYITTLVAYCAITGEAAEGQPYSFYNDTSLNEKFDMTAYFNQYYTNGADDTNADEIFASESDMRGLQQLVDRYFKAKPHLQEPAF